MACDLLIHKCANLAYQTSVGSIQLGGTDWTGRRRGLSGRDREVVRRMRSLCAWSPFPLTFSPSLLFCPSPRSPFLRTLLFSKFCIYLRFHSRLTSTYPCSTGAILYKIYTLVHSARLLCKDYRCCVHKYRIGLSSLVFGFLRGLHERQEIE